MAREFVNEGSACTVRARFSNLGVLTAPASIRYRIKDSGKLDVDCGSVNLSQVLSSYAGIPARASDVR